MSARRMKIGELARKAGVQVSTVRFYERQGLLPKPKTTSSGYREYTGRHLEQLQLIVAARRRRFPVSAVRMLLAALESEEPCREIAELVSERIEALDKQIAELRALRRLLEAQLRAWRKGTLPKADCLCAILQTNVLGNWRDEYMTTKRLVEVFVSGCPLCAEALETVRKMACDACQVEVYDISQGSGRADALAKAKQYGIHRVPAVVVDGKLCDCCAQGPVSEQALRAAGVGQAP